MARYQLSLDATIGVAKTCASAHPYQPSSSASEATERVVSRGTGVVSGVVSLSPSPSEITAGDDQNQQEKAAFERWKSTAQAQHHYRHGRDLYLDQILIRGKTTLSAGSLESRRGSLGPSYRLLSSESSERIEWRQFGEARAFARSLSLESKEDWDEWSQMSKERPRDIPADPCLVYGGEGGPWQGWPDFLGREFDSSGSRSTRRWLRFEEARDYVRSLGLKSWKEWKEWKKSGQRPPDVPSCPDEIYKGEGWLSWGDFLGFKEGYDADAEWRSFEEARDYVRCLVLRSQKKWKEWSKSGERPRDIPSRPDQVYKEEGWLSWGDFLGYTPGHVAEKRSKTKRRTFTEARDYVRSFCFKSKEEWREWSKSGLRPSDIPSDPDLVYKDKGWLSWADFLGFNKGNVAREWRPFGEARDFVRSIGLKSQKEWQEWSKAGERPPDIPSNPDQVYKGKGWMGYVDFLGYKGYSV